MNLLLTTMNFQYNIWLYLEMNFMHCNLNDFIQGYTQRPYHAWHKVVGDNYMES